MNICRLLNFRYLKYSFLGISCCLVSLCFRLSLKLIIDMSLDRWFLVHKLVHVALLLFYYHGVGLTQMKFLLRRQVG